MKEHCSASSKNWFCIFTFIFIFILGCAGCRKPPMFHIVASNSMALETDQYKVFLNGREVGTVTGRGKLEFDAEGRRGGTSEEMLPKDIEVKIPWDCGWVNTHFDLGATGAAEMERARTEHRAIPTFMSLSSDPPPFDLVDIFLDNRGGPAQTVSIGELKEQVPAGVARKIMLAYSGDCERAKDVRLNGEIVAPANTPRGKAPASIHRTLLIDVTKSHCYHIQFAGYGIPVSGYGNAIYRPRPYQYLDDQPDHFMEPLPGSVVISESQMGTTISTLKDVACPKR